MTVGGICWVLSEHETDGEKTEPRPSFCSPADVLLLLDVRMNLWYRTHVLNGATVVQSSNYCYHLVNIIHQWKSTVSRAERDFRGLVP
jgi:hypothetical protein